jgi:hypothetical protein
MSVRRRLLALVSVAVLGVAACDPAGGGGDGEGAEDDAKEALTAAVESLPEAEGITVVFTIISSPASLGALFEGALTLEQAQQILDSSITFSQKNTGDPAEVEQLYVADIAGLENAFELRIVNLIWYLRADVRGIAEGFGADVSQIDAFAEQAVSQGLDFLGPAVDGEWIAVTGMEQFQQAQGEASLDRQMQQFGHLLDALVGSADAGFEGEDAYGDHLVATIPIREVVDEFAQYAQETGQPFQAPSDVPDEDAEIDVWLDGGELNQVEVDLMQFLEMSEEGAPVGVDQLGLRLEFDQGPVDVEEPRGAHEVNVQELMQALGGGAFGTETETAPPEDFCKQVARQLETAPPDARKKAIEELRLQCPELERQI